ncbi:hypothetical protein CSA37_03120 [Candidatus Fermentibacteria bacterium]|nr:MAG: hypothetical protein CSA37_03120 [Candidatus Fermentibacteria bacterium]
MKFSAILIFILAVAGAAQTPLEFGIVQDLVGGTPGISVFSIKTLSMDGVTTLQIAARAGISVTCTRHSLLADTATFSEVVLDGQVCYSASLDNMIIKHFFQSIRDNMDRHGSGGITAIQADFITGDEMGWISVSVPLSRMDSLLAGDISYGDFWAVTPVREVEVGTLGFPVVNMSPLPEIHAAPDLPEPVEVVVQENHAWKSLILPGWGQMSSGIGVPVVNILVEAAGAVLLFTEDYQEAGIGILAVNHIISFTDLL